MSEQRRVTQILNEVFGEPELFGSPEDIQFWMERGTAVHKATELFDQGKLDWNTVDPRILGRVKAWQKFRNEIGGEIIALETKVESVKLNYRGRLDRVIRKCRMFPLDDVVVDIKSGKPFPICALQTTGYKIAWKEQNKGRRRIRRMAVELSETGYKTHVYNDDALDDAAWKACCSYGQAESQGIIKNWKERNGMNE